MNRTDQSNNHYWRGCCAGCFVESALMLVCVAGSMALVGTIEPDSVLASLLAALLFPATYVIGSVMWSFSVFMLMGLDAFRKSVSSGKEVKTRWLPESTSARPGAIMYIPTGIICALLATIILRAEARPDQYQSLTMMYLLIGGCLGLVLWVLGRNKIVGPLSPLLQWLIESF
jgi:hypothetical protein